MANKDEDKEILKELREITKTKENWGEVIDDVANKLNENHSVIVKAKILWLLGEMGLNYPLEVKKYVADIADYIDDDCPKLRERSVNALGRIGRADKHLIAPYLEKLQWLADNDTHPVVRIHSTGAIRITKRALKES